MKFTLYPIYWLAGGADDEHFDLGKLPFDVTDGVRIEAVSERFREGEFDHTKQKLGEDVVEVLEGVRYALVHRYQPEPAVDVDEHTGKFTVIGSHEHNEHSEALIRKLAACLRLIRPMRQHALLMRGNIREEDGSFDVMGFDVPTLHIQEVPELQTLFSLRNRDADDLRRYAPEFLRGMQGQFWKFRMAVQFHELGHFQPLDWKARYLLWCSAIESIYTSHDWEHQGSLVAISRIKWFLGEETSIYAPGDISELLHDPHITIRQIVGDLYEMRNFLAHGDRIPDPFFTEILRYGFNGGVQKREVLAETASFLIRSSLLKILRDGLLNHFADAASAEAYFSAQNLTRSLLRSQRDTAGGLPSS
jgi:hypothetical protein